MKCQPGHNLFHNGWGQQGVPSGMDKPYLIVMKSKIISSHVVSSM